MNDENTIQPEVPQANEQVFISEPAVDEHKHPQPPLLTASLVMNAILLIGLVILYILFFTSKKEEQVKIPFAFQKTGGNSMKVVFVNIDTLNSRYEFVKVLKNDLEGTGKRLQNEILGEQAAFEKEAADFQKQVAANTIPEDRAKIIYEALMQKQQALMEKKDRYTQQVGEKEMDMNKRLLDTVSNFLKRYNRIYRYDYILGFREAGEILVGNDTLDITNDVLGALNKEYDSRKK
jgi:outer membrane protein